MVEKSDLEEEPESKPSFKAVCAECKQECEIPFEPTEDRPVYCRDCFMKRRPPRRFQRRDNFSRGPRKMFKAVCAECKQECEIPFEPRDGKPVYCRDCFQSRRNNQEEF